MSFCTCFVCFCVCFWVHVSTCEWCKRLRTSRWRSIGVFLQWPARSSDPWRLGSWSKSCQSRPACCCSRTLATAWRRSDPPSRGRRPSRVRQSARYSCGPTRCCLWDSRSRWSSCCFRSQSGECRWVGLHCCTRWCEASSSSTAWRSSSCGATLGGLIHFETTWAPTRTRTWKTGSSLNWSPLAVLPSHWLPRTSCSPRI